MRITEIVKERLSGSGLTVMGEENQGVEVITIRDDVDPANANVSNGLIFALEDVDIEYKILDGVYVLELRNYLCDIDEDTKIIGYDDNGPVVSTLKPSLSDEAVKEIVDAINIDVVKLSGVPEVMLANYKNDNVLFRQELPYAAKEEDEQNDGCCKNMNFECGEEITEDDIKQRCAELTKEIESSETIGVQCYVGDREKFLENGTDCNITMFDIFDKVLITNTGIEILDITIDKDMNGIEDVVLTVRHIYDDNKKHAYEVKVEELFNAGFATFIGSVNYPIELSGLEYRCLTTICNHCEFNERLEIEVK